MRLPLVGDVLDYVLHFMHGNLQYIICEPYTIAMMERLV